MGTESGDVVRSVVVVADHVFEKCVPLSGRFVDEFTSEFLNDCAVGSFYDSIRLWIVWSTVSVFDFVLMAKVFELPGTEVFVAVCQETFRSDARLIETSKDIDYCCGGVGGCRICPDVTGVVVDKYLNILGFGFVS